jgi:hypothetical protein
MDSKLNWLNAALIAVLVVAAVSVQAGYVTAMPVVAMAAQ